MKIAIATWQNRIAPVFDVCKQILVIDLNQGELKENILIFHQDTAMEKGQVLSEAGVKVLVCGAISKQLLHFLKGLGLLVLPFVSGKVQEVLCALEEGFLPQARFAMPGCRRRRAGWGRLPFNFKLKEETMVGNGNNKGQGRGTGAGRGRMGGSRRAGPGGRCICPACGQTVAHQQGVPCFQEKCPKCGTTMTRE